MKIAILVSKYTPKRINRIRFSKISSREIPHNKCVSKIFIFLYKKWHFLKKIKKKNWSKYTLKRTKLHRYKKIFSGGACPQTPLAMRMASPCAACRFATCKFPNLKKKFLGPPLPNPGDAPELYCNYVVVMRGWGGGGGCWYLAHHKLFYCYCLE